MTSVLIVSNLFPPQVVGGAEIVAHRQALALRDRGFNVTIFAGGLPSEGAEPGALDFETVSGLPVYRLTMRSLSPDANFFWEEAASRFRAVFKSAAPDVVHFHNVMGLGANLIPLAKSLGARTVVTLHDHWGFCFKNTRLRNDGALCENAEECAMCLPGIAASHATLPIRLRRDYVAWCLEQADQLLSPSAYLARAYRQVTRGRLQVSILSNGINQDDIDISVLPAGEPVRFVAFGYLGEHKGLPVLIKAAERLALDPDLTGRWTLTIAGHGHLEADLHRAIADGRFGEAVSFVGRLEHDAALSLMKQSHVVVLASSWPENEPVTMLEAIATGTAQLASRIGGNLVLVELDAAGLLFTPGDDEDLAVAMRRLIIEPELAPAFGAYNGRRRHRFAERNTIDRLAELLESPAESRPAAEGPIVLCAGEAPADGVRLMAHHLHRLEDKPGSVRLVWHEWADPSLWRKAALLWLWSPDCEAEAVPVISKALRHGVPVLAPAGSTGLACADRFGARYDSLLDALAWIAAVEQAPSRSGDLAASRMVARKLNAVAPRASFRFSANLDMTGKAQGHDLQRALPGSFRGRPDSGAVGRAPERAGHGGVLRLYALR